MGKKSTEKEKIDLESLFIELLQQFDASIEGYLWPWEEARWYELGVFAHPLKKVQFRVWLPGGSHIFYYSFTC